MSDQNIEDEEHAADIFWRDAFADWDVVARGHQLADIVEEKTDG